jgi:hypothetical protein
VKASAEDMARRVAIAKKVSPYLNTQMAAFYVGLSASALEKMRCKGEGPQFCYHGRHVRYHLDDLDEWSRRHKHSVVHRSKIHIV